MECLQRFWAGARDGRWLTKERATHYPALILVGLVLGLTIGLAGPKWRGIEGKGDLKFAIDFVMSWSTARLAADGRAAVAYDFDQLSTFASAISGHPDTSLSFFYPPTYFLAVYPLSFLTSYWLAFVLWLSATGAGYLLVLWKTWPNWRALWIGAASPIVYIVIINGQNGFLSASLLGGGLVLLSTRPSLGGVLIGLATMKPHLGILVPLALIAARQWTAFLSACIAAVLLALATVGFFGVDIWKAYLEVGLHSDNLLTEEWLSTWKIQSFYAAAMTAGAPKFAAHGLQAAAFVCAAAAVIWTWRRDVDPRLKTTVLLFAAPIATPYVHDYDLSIVAIGVASYAVYGFERGFRPYEKTLLALLWILPLFARLAPYFAGVTLTPWLMAAALGVAVHRVAEDSKFRVHRSF